FFQAEDGIRAFHVTGVQTCALPISRLLASGADPVALASGLAGLETELVPTAHPTEVARRSLIQKYDALAAELAASDHDDLTERERADSRLRLRRLIAEAWYTEEIRRQRPTPLDEAKWG